MKLLCLVIRAIGCIVAVLATPIAIGFGLYEWVGNDVEFKFALWYGFKIWLTLLIGGAVAGFIFYYLGS